MTDQTTPTRPFWHTILIKLDDWAVRKHLRRTEEYLRKSNVSYLSPDLQISRERNLDHLRNYWQAGQFPRNTASSRQRVPCFIDEKGTHCAVGYLVLASGHPDAAQQIAREANYAYLPDMDFPVLTSWVEQSGLTPAELERIQPSYCPADYDPQMIYAAGRVWMAVILAGVIGLPFSVWNGWDLLNNHPRFKRKRVIGAVAGFIMLLLGLMMLGMVATGNDALFHPDAFDPVDLAFEPCYWAMSGGSPPEIEPTHAGYMHGLAAMLAGILYLVSFGGLLYKSRRLNADMITTEVPGA